MAAEREYEDEGEYHRGGYRGGRREERSTDRSTKMAVDSAFRELKGESVSPKPDIAFYRTNNVFPHIVAAITYVRWLEAEKGKLIDSLQEARVSLGIAAKDVENARKQAAARSTQQSSQYEAVADCPPTNGHCCCCIYDATSETVFRCVGKIVEGSNKCAAHQTMSADDRKKQARIRALIEAGIVPATPAAPTAPATPASRTFAEVVKPPSAEQAPEPPKPQPKRKDKKGKGAATRVGDPATTVEQTTTVDVAAVCNAVDKE